MMTLLKSLEEVVQCVSVHDHCEVLDRHTKPMISHPILHHRRQPSRKGSSVHITTNLGIIICPNLLASICGLDETAPLGAMSGLLLYELDIHQAGAEHLERAPSILQAEGSYQRH